MATLTITDEDGSQRTVNLSERDLRIGRAPDNDLVLGDSTKGVSRMHAELRFEGGRYVIIDLNSQNGTWVNGERVQRAEIPPGAEISIGAFRLTIQGAAPPAPPPAETQAARMVASAASPSATIVAPAARAAAPAEPPVKTAKRPVRPAAKGDAPKPGLVAALARLPKPVLFGGFFAIALIIVVLGQIFAPSDSSAPGTRPAASPQAGVAKPEGETNEQIIARHLQEGKALVDKGDYEAAIRDHFDRILLVDPNHAEATDLKAKAQEKLEQERAAAAASQPSADAPPVAATTIPTPGGAAAAAAVPASTVPPPASGAGGAAASSAKASPAAPAAANLAAAKAGGPAAAARASAANTGRGPREPDIPVSRNPGESVQAWRERALAIQGRYASSKAALDRGDFAAAAAGFDSILKEEPAFLDAPELLIRSREGLRGSARDAFEAGNKLDAAGDWVGALQKYEQARAVDPAMSGLDDAVKRVRDKMRVAGTDAFKRARQYDALGRTTDAVKDYEKAAEWLPPDDPNRKVAHDRADQLKPGVK